jgi:hydroxymethylpyrimidine/phosphomethylpyrimidine kinase
MRAELLPRAFVVTPNIPEAEVLAGIEIHTADDRRLAARRIAESGASAVIIKGGHLHSPDIQDLLFEGGVFTEFRHERIVGRHTHGTGCTFAAALTAHLALGRRLIDAIPLAQDYIAGAISHAPNLGRGNGPIQHLRMDVDGELGESR